MTETAAGGFLVPAGEANTPQGSIGVPYPNTSAKVWGYNRKTFRITYMTKYITNEDDNIIQVLNRSIIMFTFMCDIFFVYI